MNSDVFISYSTYDKLVADAICTNLESNGIRCWIAPRDIFPGSDWAQSITEAIKSCKIMVLIFSKYSNDSPQVSKELNLAVSHKLTVVPFKIDNCAPSGNMEYFLADMHWLDAINGDMKAEISHLTEVVARLINHTIKDTGSANGQNGCFNNIPNYTAPGFTVPGVDPNNVNVPNTDPTPNGYKPQFNTQDDVTGCPPQPSAKPVGFVEAYKNMWKNCFNFKGRASRAEYWKAVVVNVICSVLLLFIFGALIEGASYDAEDGLIVAMLISYVILQYPQLPMAARRLRDANFSPVWLLLVFTGYGSIVLLIFLCLKSVYENNKHV